MDSKNYKSIFVLHVYKHGSCKKSAYSIDNEDIEQYGNGIGLAERNFPSFILTILMMPTPLFIIMSAMTEKLAMDTRTPP